MQPSENLDMSAGMDAVKYYSNYHGHRIADLQMVLDNFRQRDMPIVYLAGDSSLDNKHWLWKGDRRHCDGDCFVQAPWQYSNLLNPAKCIQDVSYWINKLTTKRVGALNCAVEESTIAGRDGELMKQDCFVRDNITSRDSLIISVGGNDIALRPAPMTIFCMLLLIWTPVFLIRAGVTPGLGYFVKMFKDKVQDYADRMTSKTRPRQILICMIYFPDEMANPLSWADKLLGWMGYNSNPQKLQLIIRSVFAKATCRIRLEGTEVKAVPLYRILDSKNSGDYKDRVEPSAQGGMKMASAFLNILFKN